MLYAPIYNYLISQALSFTKKGRHISWVVICAIWMQNFFLRESIFENTHKKKLTILHLLLKIINSQQNQIIEMASCTIAIVKDIILMLNILCSCIIYIYTITVDQIRAMCTTGINFLDLLSISRVSSMSVNRSSGGRSICPSKRPEIPAFPHPFAMCCTQTGLLR